MFPFDDRCVQSLLHRLKNARHVVCDNCRFFIPQTNEFSLRGNEYAPGSDESLSACRGGTEGAVSTESDWWL